MKKCYTVDEDDLKIRLIIDLKESNLFLLTILNICHLLSCAIFSVKLVKCSRYYILLMRPERSLLFHSLEGYSCK